MAAKNTNKSRNNVKGSIIVTDRGQSLFVSVPNASPFDDQKQEATILLNEDAANKVKAQLQDFMDSDEVKASGIKDTGFVENLFKEDTDQDGNPTGLQRLKAKTAMKYGCKLYDAAGAAFDPDNGFSLPNRADIKMSFTPEVMSTSMFTGITLRLKAIKILNMPSYDDGMAGVEEDGSFSASAAPTAAESDGFEADPSDNW